VTGLVSRRRSRPFALALALVAFVAGVLPAPTAGAAGDDPPKLESPRFPEVGRIPVVPVERDSVTGGQENFPDASGWLILSPATRRGYTLVEGGSFTDIQSFDLDTLKPGGRVRVPGYPIAGGRNDVTAGAAYFAGDIVHAVDSQAGRIYLPMGLSHPHSLVRNSADLKRLPTYFAVLDEAQFDRDPGRAFGTFSYPLAHQHLQDYDLMGMAVSRHHVAPGERGKLLLAFAQPYVPGATVTSAPGVYDHELVQWDPGDVPTGNPPPATQAALYRALPVTADWAATLTPCASASMSASAGYEFPDNGQKNYQWGILAKADAVLTGCQTAANSGAVVRVALDRATGQRTPLDPQVAVSLGKPVGDVLVDEGAGRLFLKSFGSDGSTWWVFDSTDMRFTGSVAGNVVGQTLHAAGVDPSSGRFFMLAHNQCAVREGKALLGALTYVPVRGGLKMAEAGLDPVPAAENLVPELSAASAFRIAVDPVTRRVFLRRGNVQNPDQEHYPSCDQRSKVLTHPEPFWRVHEDRTPLAAPTDGLDDSGLTTNVAEDPARTQASYLGTGSGYGSRSVLTGGVDALTRGAATSLQSPCGRDDREALAGAVGRVEVSDQATAADAAALDGDARTQEALGDPLSRCRPQAKAEQVGGDANAEQVNGCHADVREGAFDQAKPGAAPPKGGACPERDGQNRYAASCLGTKKASMPGFDDGDHRLNGARGGFAAEVACDERDEKASGRAVGSLSSTSTQQADPVKVARSSSEVTVSRKLGKGVTVKVDSVARGVEIPGVGTIGVVRAEAVSTATGRDGRASATYTRTICDIDVKGVVIAGCIGDERTQQTVVKAISDTLRGRGTARLRNPDPALAAGTRHGYLAALQRDRKELFGDQVVTKDRSLAVPAIEIVMYQGDGGAWGAGRQVFHLAGVQASTSYGIACTWGRRADGTCAEEGGEGAGFFAALPSEPGGAGGVHTVYEQLPGASGGSAASLGLPRENVITRLLRAIPRAVAEALRLLFNNPRELGLLAALWALLYAPCYLGDRRRAVRQVAARRLTSGLGAA
jgi:hypothetical protein